MAGIFSWLKRSPDPTAEAARLLCDAVIAKARLPWAYENAFVEDTFEGRFAMTSLYGGLVMRRLRSAEAGGLALAEKLGEALFDRFDYALREQGVGDSSIARKARKLGEEFFGLARAVNAALNARDVSVSTLSPVLQRNGLGGPSPDPLSVHVLAVAQHLERCRDEDLLCGQITWTA
ncbi:MAG: ubiquinol-cytochrome C chaperone family protein [Pseudomonadota bacterium]